MKWAMIEEFEVSAEHGIPIVVVAGARLILDTGSPVSFARTGSITLGGCEHQVPVDCWAGNPDSLSELLGEPVDGLLGCDLLAGRILDLNCPAGRAHVISDDANPETPCWLANAIPLPVSRAMGVPIAQISVNGRQASAASIPVPPSALHPRTCWRARIPSAAMTIFIPALAALDRSAPRLDPSRQRGNSVCFPVAAAPAVAGPASCGPGIGRRFSVEIC